MKFSLVQVYKDNGETVDGVWLQNHIGTVETAEQAARDTEAANSIGKISVAVVEDLSYIVPPNYELMKGLKRIKSN